MSLKDLFNRKVVLIYCPHCTRVKKHNKWVTLTPELSQKLSGRHSGFNLITENCTICEQEQALGIG